MSGLRLRHDPLSGIEQDRDGKENTPVEKPEGSTAVLATFYPVIKYQR
jgi:hypothetical protein